MEKRLLLLFFIIPFIVSGCAQNIKTYDFEIYGRIPQQDRVDISEICIDRLFDENENYYDWTLGRLWMKDYCKKNTKECRNRDNWLCSVNNLMYYPEPNDEIYYNMKCECVFLIYNTYSAKG